MVFELYRRQIDEMHKINLVNTDNVTVKFPLEIKTKKVLKSYGPTKQVVYIVGTHGEFMKSNEQLFNVELNSDVQEQQEKNKHGGGCC